MCGIAGLISRDKNRVTSGIRKMVASLRHRGPDDSGEFFCNHGPVYLGLGHTRLSIIDLSDKGRQPMINKQTGNTLVYNGELYNFTELRDQLKKDGAEFVGNSDTEVVLQALEKWGPSAISRFNGMYALAFLDKKNGTLLLARDPLGIKPLYYARKGTDIAFASEVRSVLSSGFAAADLDDAGLAGYLAYGAVQSPSAFFKNIKMFPAGHYQEIRFAGDGVNEQAPVRYWTYPPLNEQSEDVEDNVRQILDNAVKRHMVSDVPVGVFLSSGIDSTVIASLASQHAADLRTFTVGVPGDDALDESRVAEETAKRIGSKHTNITVSLEEARDMALSWLFDMDVPTMDGLNVYVISEVVRNHGIVVALSGQGGDELFGGYPSFEDVPRWSGFAGKLSIFPGFTKRALAKTILYRKGISAVEKAQDILSGDSTLHDIYFHKRRTLSNKRLEEFGLFCAHLGLNGSYILPGEDMSLILPDDPVAAVSILESHYYLGNMLLRDSDVFGMAHSLEIRVPMLDKEVLNYVYRLPGKTRLPDETADKHLLRKTFGKYLSEGQLAASKRGFMLPISEWMTSSLREICEEGIKHLKSNTNLNPDAVQRVWSDFLSEPKKSIWSRAWQLCVLGIYLKNTSEKKW